MKGRPADGMIAACSPSGYRRIPRAIGAVRYDKTCAGFYRRSRSCNIVIAEVKAKTDCTRDDGAKIGEILHQARKYHQSKKAEQQNFLKVLARIKPP
jgi:hypothetical protein